MKKKKKLKIDKTKSFYFFVLFLIFSIFLILFYLNFEIKKQISEVSVNLTPFNFTLEDYPVIESRNVPTISAKGAVIIDNDSKVPIYSKNPNLRFLPASTTKIMTALVALDYYNLDDLLTINKTNVGGAISEFSEGEKFKFEDMLYAMMLPSNNDAALAIAENYPGGSTEFIKKMNEKAKSFSLKNTKFADPIGLEDDNFTTPIDLARLTSFALENPEFEKVVGTKSREITSMKGDKYFLGNLNELLDIPGVNGVKTGYTQSAGEVLVTSKYIEGFDKNLIIVVMRSEDRFSDTEILLEYLKNITYRPIHP